MRTDQIEGAEVSIGAALALEGTEAVGSPAGDAATAPRRYFHRQVLRVLRQHVRPQSRVLQIGCQFEELLPALGAASGVCVDPCPQRLTRMAQRHPRFRYVRADSENFDVRGPFDVVLLCDVVADSADIQTCLQRVRRVCDPSTRIILLHYNLLWEPVLKLASLLGLRRRTPEQNWLTAADVDNLLTLAGFEAVRRTDELLMPVGVPGLSALCNRVLARLWPTRALSLLKLVVAKPVGDTTQPDRSLTCSVVIPTRNERGNIADAVRRTPQMGAHTELIFVDGDSTDGTAEEIERVIAENPDRDIRLIRQGQGRGKGDAVRKGFAAARGDILMILDADLTVPPEELPKFFDGIASGKAEFINGTRLVYPMQRDAMRFLNKLANAFFSRLFTWLLEQRFRDTLCGTKVLRRRDYERIAADRAYFGDFDPFGDFDLIFGAAKANLKILEIPIRYRARAYGESNIRRFLHGLLLLRMSGVALRKLKLR